MRPIVGITCSFSDDRNSVPHAYAKVIEHFGGVAIHLPHTESIEVINRYLSLIDGLILSGGGDPDALIFGEEPHPKIGRVDPIRDWMEIELTKKALRSDLPIFGICRGSQMLNIVAGGTIYQDIPSELPRSNVCHAQNGVGWYASHTIEIQPNTILFQAFGSTEGRVNSFHHQAIGEVADGFIATAVAKDGVIEAIESRDHRFAIGVQFHPELMWERHVSAQNMFQSFIKPLRSLTIE